MVGPPSVLQLLLLIKVVLEEDGVTIVVVLVVVETPDVVDMVEAVDEEMIEVMMIAVEVIAIVPEIATGDTVVGMTK